MPGRWVAVYRVAVRPRTRLIRATLAVLGICAPSVVLAPATGAAASSCTLTNQQYRAAPPLTDVPWPLARLNPSAVWPLSRGGGVTVAVIDSGVSKAPSVLAGRLSPASKDYVRSKGGDPFCDPVGHGTLVAAIIAGRDGQGLFTGVAPNSTIVSIRVTDKEDAGVDLSARLATAIRYAANHADIINISISTAPSDALRAAIRYAHSRDVVVVASAGNADANRAPGPVYPAAYDSVIAVAGVDESGQHVTTSVSGGYVDVAAPGVDIVGPGPVGSSNLQLNQGTSFAAAYVSGTAALLRAYDGKLSADAIAARITATADRPADGVGPDLGAGVVNPYRALTTIVSTRADGPAPNVPPLRMPVDRLHTRKVIAAWAAFGGAFVAGCLLFGGRLLRAGRRRRWRPGQLSTSD
jgi:type VII secretion-associated serine protease mycosin